MYNWAFVSVLHIIMDPLKRRIFGYLNLFDLDCAQHVCEILCAPTQVLVNHCAGTKMSYIVDTFITVVKLLK